MPANSQLSLDEENKSIFSAGEIVGAASAAKLKHIVAKAAPTGAGTKVLRIGRADGLILTIGLGDVSYRQVRLEAQQCNGDT